MSTPASTMPTSADTFHTAVTVHTAASLPERLTHSCPVAWEHFLKNMLLGMMVVGSLGSTCLARNVYLNGIDISGATSQTMTGVDLQINNKGDVFITAPHYEVHEEDSYTPLSSYLKTSVDEPQHKAPQALQIGQSPLPSASIDDPADADKSPSSLQEPAAPASLDPSLPPAPASLGGSQPLPTPARASTMPSLPEEKAGSKTP